MNVSPDYLASLAQQLLAYSNRGMPAPHALRAAAKDALAALGWALRYGYPRTDALALACLVAAVDLEDASEERRPARASASNP